MNNKVLVDSFDVPASANKWKLNESTDSESVVDGVNILGRAVGPFFAVNSDSRNHRFYSKELWERAIENNRDRMKNGEMIGTIGHNQSLDDQALLEGKVSHRVSRLWIDEDTNTGMGEILIINSTAGRELNALLRGGVRLKISSRALGEYKGKTSSGSDIIDESTFELQGFDFVQIPGVVNAIPVLVESKSEEDDDEDEETKKDNLQKSRNTTEPNMEYMEQLVREKAKLESDLAESLEKNKLLAESNSSLNKLVRSRSSQMNIVRESLKGSDDQLRRVTARLARLQEELRRYRKLGSPRAIEECLDRSRSIFRKYMEFGKPKQLTEAFKKANYLISSYRNLGTPAEIKSVLEYADGYSRLGSLSSIARGQRLIKTYEKLGSPKVIASRLNLLGDYVKLGSPHKIAEAFRATDNTLRAIQNNHRKAQVKSFSESYKIPRQAAAELISKHGLNGARRLLEDLKYGSDVSSRYQVSAKPSLNETLPARRNVNRNSSSYSHSRFDNSTSRLTNLFERFNKN